MIRTRLELVDQLCVAVEIEHSICCQYLYAAFTIRDQPGESRNCELFRQWKRTILRIARQEMAHMGTMCNLVSTYGGMPHFNKTPFAVASYRGLQPMLLEPFSKTALNRFIRLESADRPGKADDSINEWYQVLLEGIRNKKIKTMNNAHQLTPSEINPDDPGFMERFDLHIEPIRTRRAALRALTKVIEQGEGVRGNAKIDGHYEELIQIRDQFRPKMKPSLEAVTNPVLFKPPVTASKYVVISNRRTRLAMQLFNRAYTLILILLAHLFTDQSKAPRFKDAIRYLVFFPLMTQIIRPLGEVLTRMPADLESGPRAGPSFETPVALNTLERNCSGIS